MAFDRSSFLNLSAAFPREEVSLPEFGGSVWVRSMSAGERDRFEEVHSKLKNIDYRARLAVATMCDAEGNALFSESDIPSLSALPSNVFDRVLDVAHRLNGFGGEAREDARKNSESVTGSA